MDTQETTMGEEKMDELEGQVLFWEAIGRSCGWELGSFTGKRHANFLMPGAKLPLVSVTIKDAKELAGASADRERMEAERAVIDAAKVYAWPAGQTLATLNDLLEAVIKLNRLATPTEGR